MSWGRWSGLACAALGASLVLGCAAEGTADPVFDVRASEAFAQPYDVRLEPPEPDEPRPPIALPRLVEVTAEAGLPTFAIDAAAREPDCLMDSIATTPPQDMCVPEWFTGAAAAGDFDGDGLVDLYVTSVYGRDRLYRNLGDGRFEDVAEAAGIPVAHSSAATFGDIDDDGDLDVFVSTIGDLSHLMLVNDGTGRFEDQARARGVALWDGLPLVGMSSAFGDYDRDGDLDLYVTEWRPINEIHAAPFRSRLLRNRGPRAPGHFRDVTASAGVSFDTVTPLPDSGGPGIFTFAPAFVDLDADGWLDLAITGDFGTSRLFWNDRDGTFTDGTREARVGTAHNAMGSAFGDLDGDGDLDWFVTSLWNPPWRPAVPDSGNRLYRNLGDRRFIDSTDTADVRVGGWGWGAAFFDLDNDGDEDLAMTNGWFAPTFTDDASLLWVNEHRLLPLREVGSQVGFDTTGQGRGVLPFDYDADGDLDVLLTQYGERHILYRNDGAEHQPWLRVRLRGTASDTEAVGAVVAVDDGERTLVRVIGAGARYNAQLDRVAHFGLGWGEGPVPSVRVTWPSGTVQTLTEVERRQQIVVVEPER